MDGSLSPDSKSPATGNNKRMEDHDFEQRTRTTNFHRTERISGERIGTETASSQDLNGKKPSWRIVEGNVGINR